MAKKKVEGDKEVIQEAQKDIYTQLFAFQKEEIVIPKRGVSEIQGKKYKYVLLDDLIYIIRPMLQDLGLLFVQVVNGEVLDTEIRHVNSGTSIKSQVALGKPSSAQDLGARITYARRYALTALLGIVADDDIDADEGKKAPAEVKTPPKAEGESDAFTKAKLAIESCQNDAAMEALKDQVGRSVKLNAREKEQLLELIKQKDHEINGTIQA